MTFYCQQQCGDVDFSIDDWNEAFKHCVDNNLSEEQTSEILEGSPCDKQCFDCMAIIGERRIKTKELRCVN